MQHKTKFIFLKYCFEHVGKRKVLSKLDQCCRIIIVQPHVVIAVFLRLWTSDQAHQNHNSSMSDWHYGAHRFDLYLEI